MKYYTGSPHFVWYLGTIKMTMQTEIRQINLHNQCEKNIWSFCKNSIISLTSILEIGGTYFLVYFLWISGCSENNIKSVQICEVVCGRESWLSTKNPFSPFFFYYRTPSFSWHIVASLKSVFPSSLEAYNQILASGMPLLGLSFKVMAVLFSGLFSTGWDTNVREGSGAATLSTTNSICAFSVRRC